MEIRKQIPIVVCVVSAVVTAETHATFAHSGGLNASGCHGGSKPYHCHRLRSEMVITSEGKNRLRCDLGSSVRHQRLWVQIAAFDMGLLIAWCVSSSILNKLLLKFEGRSISWPAAVGFSLACALPFLFLGYFLVSNL